MHRRRRSEDHASLFGAVNPIRRPSLAHLPLLLENFSYAMRAGTVNSASVPAPGSLQIFNRPPMFLARSCMPGIPQCPVRALFLQNARIDPLTVIANP